MLQALTDHRRSLHRIPEIGFALPKTKAYLLDALRGMRAEIEEVAESGLTAFFDAGRQSCVAFRADMDALGIEERTGAEYASTHPGAMHACGHDAHMAILLAFAGHVDERLPELPHNVLLIFQPAEESGGGGKAVADTLTLERHNARAIFALHVDPRLSIGEVGSRPGAFMARASEVWIDVTGRAAHVARADEGIDATYACAEVYRRITEMERAMHSAEPRLLKFGLMRSGTAQNILSGSARLGGTMRTFTEQDYNYLKEHMQKIAREVASETGAVVVARVADGYPPVINDARLFDLAKDALGGLRFRTLERPSFLGEDFSYYMRHVPGLMLQLGVGRAAPLHSPEFDFDERALLTGVEVLTRLCMLTDFGGTSA